jgi:hypothetical protein
MAMASFNKMILIVSITDEGCRRTASGSNFFRARVFAGDLVVARNDGWSLKWGAILELKARQETVATG